MSDSPKDLTDKQKWAIHFFDERGNSVISQIHIIKENEQLRAENERLKALLAKLTRERKSSSEGQGDLA